MGRFSTAARLVMCLAWILPPACRASDQTPPAVPPDGDANHSDASNDGAIDVVEEPSDDVSIDAPLDAPAGCGPCAHGTYMCPSPIPNMESATLVVSKPNGDGCTASLPGVDYVIQCATSTICVASQCKPYTFDGMTLSFDHFGKPVTCTSDSL